MLPAIQRQSVDNDALENDVVVGVGVGAVADVRRRFAAASLVDAVDLVQVAAFRPEEVIAGISLGDILNQEWSVNRVN